MTEHRGQRRLERARSINIEGHIGNAEIFRQLELSALRGKAAIAAIELEPPGAPEIALRAGLGAQRLVLGDRARHQRAHQPCRFDEPGRL